jgi:hypothetical protein
MFWALVIKSIPILIATKIPALIFFNVIPIAGPFPCLGHTSYQFWLSINQDEQEKFGTTTFERW